MEAPHRQASSICDIDMKGTGPLCITLRTATWVALIFLPRSSPTAGMEYVKVMFSLHSSTYLRKFWLRCTDMDLPSAQSSLECHAARTCLACSVKKMDSTMRCFSQALGRKAHLAAVPALQSVLHTEDEARACCKGFCVHACAPIGSIMDYSRLREC